MSLSFKLAPVCAMPGKELLQTQRAQIVALHDIGWTNREIGRHLKIPRATVGYTLLRDKENRHSTNRFESRRRAGRPRATSRTTDRLLKRFATAEPTASAPEIRASLHLAHMPSVRTVQRRLLEDHDLKCYRPVHKPMLSAKNVKDRLIFAKKYLHWTPTEWRRVQFSDESTICQFASYCQFIRRPKGMRDHTRYVLPSVKCPPKIMIWGSIAAAGRGGLWFLPKGQTMNATTYLEMLEEKLTVWMNILQTTIFQHDGAPCHRAKRVTQWIEAQSFEILSPWPGSSPDLNPIENAWCLVKRKVAERNPTSVKSLMEAIKEVWTTEITAEYCSKLIDSMPERLQAVVKAHGKHTKY